MEIDARGSEKSLSFNLFQVFIHIFWFEQIRKTRNKKMEIRLNFLSIIDYFIGL